MKHISRTKLVRMEIQQLVPHPVAQRDENMPHLRDLRANFDLDAIGTIHVVEREIDGVMRFCIVDGQHRWKILMEEGFGELLVDVQIHLDKATDKDACELFLKLNHVKTVNPYDKFKNELDAGHKDAVNIVHILRTFGVRLAKSSYDGGACCVRSLQSVYSLDEGRSLTLAMDTIIPSWGKTASAMEGKLIEGFGTLFAAYNGQIDRPSLIKKLSKYPGGPSGLLGDARGLKEAMKTSVARCVAMTVINRYNSGRAVGKLDPL